MVNPEDKFVNKFSPITPEEERRQKEKELSKQRYESYKKASAPIKILTEDLKKATDRFFKVSENNIKQVLTVEVPEERQKLLEQIKVDDPLIVKNGKISIDYEKLSEILSQQINQVAQASLDKLRQNNLEAGSLAGGGGVSIKFKDVGGQKTSILKSVNDIIFTGDGVTLTRQGKNVLVNIPGASVVAEDPTIDFARESTAVGIYSQVQQIFDLMNTLSEISLPSEYPEGIGGGAWSPI